MKTLYLECNMGAAGDMLTAALIELVGDREAFVKKLNGIGIPKVEYAAESTTKCGIAGTYMRVIADGEEEHEHHHGHEHEHEHEHHHAGMHDIENVINSLSVSDKVKADAIAVYRLIAEAESHAHGREIEHIHFHEVGTLDAIADVVAVCALIEELAPERILASPVHVGYGSVHCAHGILPVPAPATAYILRGVPIYGGKINGELCTPTGAALLRHFAGEFCEMPEMRVEKIGCGMGKKDFEAANCVRAFFGETGDEKESICEICTNIDDMTGEEIGFAVEKLLAAGALDVFTTPVYMKKNRPGVMLTCLCKAGDEEKFASLIFKHTTTLGVRKYYTKRETLAREETVVDTQFGAIRAKRSTGFGISRVKAEYDDRARIADDAGVSIMDVK